MLFPGHDVVVSYPFHVTRDADIEIDEDEEEAHDLLAMMQEMLSERTFGSVVRIAVSDSMEAETRNWLLTQLGASQRELYVVSGPLALEGLRELHKLSRPDLKYPPLKQARLVGPVTDSDQQEAPSAWGDRDIFATIREHDVLVHNPYQSFEIVSDFVVRASRDSQTLWRSSKHSTALARSHRSFRH